MSDRIVPRSPGRPGRTAAKRIQRRDENELLRLTALSAITAAGRTYAAYGGMYIVVALLWLRWVDGVPLTRWDGAGAVLALPGMAVIALQPRPG